MTREVYIEVLKSVRAQLMLAADALDMCDFDGETVDEYARRVRLSAGVHKQILLLELGIEASARLAADAEAETAHGMRATPTT